jgi:hypothetical protein
MTEKEIIKGLECCNNNSVCVCLGCPLNYRHNNGCISYLTANALNLINRQKAEIEELTDKHWNECRQIAEYDDDLNALRYIAKDLLIRILADYATASKVVKQNEKLATKITGKPVKYKSETDSMVNEHDKLLKDLRTAPVTFIPKTDSKEAVKKFAEALKAELKNLSKVHLFGREFALVGEKFVDGFVEKYEGENNDI